ncbi:hypothetical protein [Burkholderia singularis]|uniref:hypothetical protein n=1 Tax=Burkholderia singularis TaxID=1503053 RepID=UPI000AF46570|nr:hypothetical protein [Burkholderia singularis]
MNFAAIKSEKFFLRLVNKPGEPSVNQALWIYRETAVLFRKQNTSFSAFLFVILIRPLIA